MMKLELQLAAATPVARLVGTVPVLALASPVHLALRLVNAGTMPLFIESPQTAQDLVLWLVAQPPGGSSQHLLNPSRIDATGEITAPMPVQLLLQPGEAFEMPVSLDSDTVDHWFKPGSYEVFVTYAGAQSGRLRFATELRAESIPALVKLALTSPDAWQREQAVALLRSVPGGPDLAMPRAGSDAAELAAARSHNELAAQRFLAQWPRLRQSAEVAAYLASVRARARGGPW